MTSANNLSLLFLQREGFSSTETSSPPSRDDAPTYFHSSDEVIVGDTVLYKYRITHHISSGRISEVYGGHNTQLRTDVAVKISPLHQTNEVQTIMALTDDDSRPVGIPIVYSYGNSSCESFIVMRRLGLSLAEYARMYGGTLHLKTVCMIAIQALKRIEYLHSKNYVHCDIKPENFLLGRGWTDRNIVYLIDYDLAQKYRDHHGQHIPYTWENKFRGTLRYSSWNAHGGIQLVRRDDLMSLGYTLIRLLRGNLPWEIRPGVLFPKDKVLWAKEYVTREKVCESLPVQFEIYLKYVEGLAFTESPEYEALRSLFEGLLEDEGWKNDGMFQWVLTEGDDKRSNQVLQQVEVVEETARGRMRNSNTL